MKKSWKKRVSGCNLVAVKTTWKFSKILGLPSLSLLEVKSFHLPSPELAPPIYKWEWITVANTMAVTQNRQALNKRLEWLPCVFCFCVKIFMHSILTCSINLLKPWIFQSSNNIGCSVGPRHQMNSIFKPEEDLNYFYNFMLLLTQKRIFEICSMS